MTHTDFGPFRIDYSNASLTRDGEAISLTPKAFALLCYLVDTAGQLASRESILDRVWPGVVVTDAALTVCIREIRSALGDDARKPLYIETVQKRGYRFICQTRLSASDSRNTSLAKTEGADIKTNERVVGRKNVLVELRDYVNRALTGNRQLVFVTGEPGIGKTTTIEAFSQEQLQLENAWTAKGQCIEHYGAGEAYAPILDALGDLARRQTRELADTLAIHAPTWLQQIPVLSAARGTVPAASQAAVRPERMLREITGALEAIAEHRLLILILEDLHWSDHPSIDLLSFLARRSPPAHLLIVASYRPADAAMRSHPVQKVKDDLQLRGHCSSVPLPFLNQHDVASYLSAAFPAHGFPADFPAAVHRKSDGNPLFMVNLLTYMQSKDLLQHAEGRWCLAEDFGPEHLGFPDDIELMIGQRIEQLDPASRGLLEAASVASHPGGVATEFTVTEVATVLAADDTDVEAGVERLARHSHFLQSLGATEWPDGTYSNSYEFTHALYQNVLYARVGASRRVHAHRKLGLRLEAGHGARCAEIANRLAVHFEVGRDYYRAVQYLTRVAETAATRGANREAIQALESARRLLEKVPPAEQRDQLETSVLLLLAAAITASQGNATPAVEDCYLRARELCERTGDQVELFRALFGLRSFYVIRGDLDKAYELAQSLLSLATTLNNADFLLEAHVGLANSEFFAGDHQASQAHALKGIALYNRELHGGHALLYGLDPSVFCYARAGQTTWYLGYPDQALHYVGQAVASAEALQHPYSLGLALLNQTQVLLHRGDKHAALNSAQQSKALAVEHEFSFLYAWALYFSAWALALNGESDASRAEIGLTHTVQRPPSAVADSYLGAFLAETYFALGDADSGLACLEVPAMEHAYDSVRSYLKAEFTAMGASTSADTRKAEALYHEAIAHSRGLGVRANELRAATGLAKLLMRRRDYSQAHEHLAPIVGWFQEGFDTADLRGARELLTSLENRLNRSNHDAKVVYLQNNKN